MQNAAEMRERLFTMRMSGEEAARFDRVAKHYGLNVAGLLRMLVMERARELGLEEPLAEAAPSAPPSKPRAKKR